VLGAVDDQHARPIHLQAAAGQVARHRVALVQAAAVRLIAQQCIEVARCGQLTQCAAQQLGLARQGRGIEVQVDRIARHGPLLDPQAGREGRFPHKGAAPRLAAHQAHRCQLGVHARSGGQRQAVRSGELAVRRQACAGPQAARSDVCCKGIDHLFVARFGHAGMYP
jgi:hypothetical protein